MEDEEDDDDDEWDPLQVSCQREHMAVYLCVHTRLRMRI